MSQIYDCFTYNNEKDILKLRLNILKDVPNLTHVLVESNRTQSLNEKPYYFESYREDFKEFADRIIHVKIDASEWSNSNNLWFAENEQRNGILLGLTEAKDNNYCLISDTDEIPDPEILQQLCENNKLYHDYISFSMLFSAYFFNLVAPRKWVGSVLTTVEKVRKFTPQKIRNSKDFAPTVHGGWHFSWIMPPEKLWEKSHSCIEPYDKSQLVSLEEFKLFFEFYKNEPEKYFICTENLGKKGEPLYKTEIDEKFPEFLRESVSDYGEFVLD